MLQPGANFYPGAVEEHTSCQDYAEEWTEPDRFEAGEVLILDLRAR